MEHPSSTRDGQVSELSAHVHEDADEERKRDHELVSVVMHVVHHALDPPPNHELVEPQSFTPDGQVSVVGAHVLEDAAQEHKREHDVVSLVMHVVERAWDHLPNHVLVVHQSFTPDGQDSELGVHVL